MSKNFDKLLSFMANMHSDFTAMGISETWFGDESDASLYPIPGYNLVSNSRLDKRGGGVAMYIPSHFDYQVHHGLNAMSNLLETLFVEILIPGRRNIVLGVVYRPPQGNISLFMSELQDMLLNPLLSNKDLFLMGDYNIDLLQCDVNNQCNDFLNLMEAFSLMPLITKPTRG